MEFVHIGTRCAVPECKQHDFLPFRCDQCKEQFCLEHRTYEAHKCPKGNVGDRQVPICPMCNQIIPLPPNADVNAVVDRHITIGCPKLSVSKQKQTTGPKCACPGCNEKPILRCKLCSKPVCLSHRIEQDHMCPQGDKNVRKPKPAPVKPKPATTTSSASKPVKLNTTSYKSVNQQLGQLHRERTAASSSTTQVIDLTQDDKPSTQKPTPVPSKPKLPTPSTYAQRSKVLEKNFSNTKTKPVGQSSIEYEDRFFLDVYFPLSTKTPPVHMFFHNNWKVGKVLDKIAEQGKVVNNNATEQDPSKRLSLFNVVTYERLTPSMTLREMEMEGAVQSGGGVILEYGEELHPDVRLAIEQAAANGGLSATGESYCIIQ